MKIEYPSSLAPGRVTKTASSTTIKATAPANMNVNMNMSVSVNVNTTKASLSTFLTTTAPSPPPQASMSEWAASRGRVSDAQALTRIILGREANDVTTSPTTDMLQAIRTFAELKHQVSTLQQESQLLKQMLATQCAARRSSNHNDEGTAAAVTVAEMRLLGLEMVEEKEDTAGHWATNPCEEPMNTEASDVPEPSAILSPPGSSEDPLDALTGVGFWQAPPFPLAEPDSTLEDDIRRILPKTKSKSLGFGLFGDEVQEQLIEWQATFDSINQQHSRQLEACHTELEQLHLRLATWELHGVATEDADRARQQLEELVRIVEAFPSRSRLEGLQLDLEESRTTEEETHVALVEASQALEVVRRREQDWMVGTTSSGTSRPGTAIPMATAMATTGETSQRAVPVRWPHLTKRRLQRLLRLYCSSRASSDLTKAESPVTLNATELHGVEMPTESLAMECGQKITESRNGIWSGDASFISELTIGVPEMLQDPDWQLQKMGSNEDETLHIFLGSEDSSSSHGDDDAFPRESHLHDHDGDMDVLSARTSDTSGCTTCTPMTVSPISSLGQSGSSSNDESFAMDKTFLTFSTTASGGRSGLSRPPPSIQNTSTKALGNKKGPLKKAGGVLSKAKSLFGFQ